jgi:putative FmdB family regulatory protein
MRGHIYRHPLPRSPFPKYFSSPVNKAYKEYGPIMPTYEYKCDTCGNVFEEFQSITAAPLTRCKTKGCGGTVHRLISSGAGFLFKGSGFYITDYRSESYKKGAKSETTAPSTPSASDSGKKTDSTVKASPSSSDAKK